jgi:phosphoribosyl-dephospho-CoA transferase
MRIHDLLEIDVSRFPPSPRWVTDSLQRTPFVVVRRGEVTAHEVPVGVRGARRSERWAASCPPGIIKKVHAPADLLRGEIPDRMPALCALRLLKELWGRDRDWGPGGSVGFELGTGEPVVTPESDLDAVIYAAVPIDMSEARTLLDATRDLPAAVDVRVETPRCGFSLAEYAQAAKLLLRTPQGPVLGIDPWNP